MKKHQFEEITAALSIIIALLAYNFGIRWLFIIYSIKAIFDFYCALKYSYISAMKTIEKKKATTNDSKTTQHENKNDTEAKG